MRGIREKVHPVPAGDTFENNGETFTVVGPLSEPEFIRLANRWPNANRLPRNRPESPFTFFGDENYIWVIVDEFGYVVSKVGIVVLDDVIGDAGAYTVGGYASHPEKYGDDANYTNRGFNTKLDEYRMPFVKELATARQLPIVYDLSNDTKNRLTKYRNLGFEVKSSNDEKHPLLPEKHFEKLKSRNRTYAIYIPNTLEDDAMRKAWSIIKKSTYEVYVYDIKWDATESDKERMPLPNNGIYYIPSTTDLNDDEEVLDAINDSVEDAHGFVMMNFNYDINDPNEKREFDSKTKEIYKNV
ncbi:MAG: hypothetical protein GOVbin140_92 [Prokaryotic dsDNA virus sp.]|nr:MAG: hypothetical protein GOVbin140_92 [Prokaryotic dsDNA virus sp.]|tara:strand:- start:50066 stop:50962 length:897 start_codon:yes stop_codon:yes gene_type:complete